MSLLNRTKTLLVTDAVIYVPSEPPEVLDPRAIQRYSGLNLVVRLQKGFRQHAEDGVQPETKEERSLWAWMRIVLLVLYFRPFE
mmetsp:Transcript_14162/g.28986  ORF Transcript_14162/g.28986 Transcript_14162/m.28986 type:complete len:84 (-) Transcript_14162:3473-3724(-)